MTMAMTTRPMIKTIVKNHLSEQDAILHAGVHWGKSGWDHVAVDYRSPHTARTVVPDHIAAAALRHKLPVGVSPCNQ